MKRWEIRQKYNLQATDAQMRRKLAELSLSTEDGHSFTDSEIEQIRAAFCQGQSQGQSQPPFASNHPEHLKTALSAQGQASQALRGATQATMQNALNWLEVTECQRAQALDRLSDRAVAALSPILFTAELLQRTAYKLEMQPGKLDIEAWEGFDIEEYRFPSLPPRSLAGELPGG